MSYNDTSFKLICKICNKEFEITEKNLDKRIIKNTPITTCTTCRKDEINPFNNPEIQKRIREEHGNPMDNPEYRAKIKETWMKKHGVENISQLKWVKDKKIETSRRTHGTDYPWQSEKGKDEQRQGILRNTGGKYDNVSKIPEVKLKKEQKAEEVYGPGVKNVFQAEEVKEKARNTLLEIYGVDNISKVEYIRILRSDQMSEICANRSPEEKQEISDRIKEAWNNGNLRERAREKQKEFMLNHPEYIEAMVKNVHTPEANEKRITTCLALYNALYTLANPLIQQKAKDTCIKKYGVDHPLKSKIIQDKISQTNLKKYGTKYPVQTQEVKDKIWLTNLILRGVPSAGILAGGNSKEENLALSQIEDVIECFQSVDPKLIEQFEKFNINLIEDDIKEIKQLEEAFKNGILSTVFTYKRQYYIPFRDIPNKGHTFDFAIFKDGVLNLLIDYDGEYFHADGQHEYNGLQSKEERDTNRLLSLPEEVKYFIINIYNKSTAIVEITKILNWDYNEWVDDQFINCRALGFPKLDYEDEILQKSWSNLLRYKKPIDKYINRTSRSGIGDRIIHHFNKSIYKSHLKGSISPYEAWNNDELLLKCIKNRFIYINKANPFKVLQGFNINKLAQKVSVFSAGNAKALVEEYINDCNIIFDPFCGYAGRLLGVCSTGKIYIGQDINETVVKENNKVIDYFHLKAEIIQKDILESKGEYDCLFTCPPYGNREIWWDNGKEIISEYSSEEWVDICLERFKCRKYLFVVDQTCKKYDSVVSFRNKSHFGINYEKVILIEK
jgi:hypothetical protein